MFRDERERMETEAAQGYSAENRYARYDREWGYEEERNRTSSSYRDSLQSSLEAPARRSRLDRADEERYGCYRAYASQEENNYDRFFDSKYRKNEKPARKNRRPLMVAYVAVALVAIIAVTMAVIGIGEKKVVESKPLTAESLMASAEGVSVQGVQPAAAEEEPVKEAVGGETYIRLKSGELVAIDIPAQTVVTEEEEKGFDKLCSWLNGVFGG